MKLVVKFYQRDFSGEGSKTTYLEACKWVAKNVISKEVEIGGDTFWRIKKVKDADLPTFRLELYAMLDSEESTKGFCNRCQEFHKAFYLNQQYNCDACNYTAFKKQMEQKLQIKKAWRKERLSYILKDEE